MKRCDPNARAKCPDGKGCELYAEYVDGSWCDTFNNLVMKQPITNADRHRAMSDEELYLWAKKQIGCGFDFFPCGVVCEGKCESYSDEDCKAKIMKWLQQPAKGE